jgi:hypothetical protein
MGVSRPERAVWCGVLVILFLGSVGWIVLGWPLGLGQTVALVLIAGASASLFSAHYLPDQLDARIKRAATVGAGCIALIAAVLAVPALQGRPRQPLTTTLTVGVPCESFAVPAELLPSVSSRSEIAADWIYDNRGASASTVLNLVVQGTTEEAVILHGLRVIDLAMPDPPSDVVTIRPCERPRLAIVPKRFLELVLTSPPTVIPRPASGPDEKGYIEPAAEFPYQVSSTEPEYFVIVVVGPACFCEWRLALDWTSGGRSGTTVIDRGFGKIRTNTGPDAERVEYTRTEDGTWDPPLPK